MSAPKGVLEVDGTLDPAQLWPSGSSDADTLHVKVAEGEGAVRFTAYPGASATPTHFLDGSRVVGRVRKAPVNAHGGIVVRLQGLDAPELHYRPGCALPASRRTKEQAAAFKALNGDFRQPCGESATRALAVELAPDGSAPLACTVTTLVETPSEVFDTYARLIGDVVVHAAAGRPSLHVNEWLLARGWALPTFYASMTPEEIERLAALAASARKAGRGVWKHWTRAIGDFEWLRFKAAASAPALTDDGGTGRSVILPKLFRRQAAWAVNERAGVLEEPFVAYVARGDDRCFGVDDFLEQGSTAAKSRRLADFIGGDGVMTVDGGDLVFLEAPAKMVTAEGAVAGW